MVVTLRPGHKVRVPVDVTIDLGFPRPDAPMEEFITRTFNGNPKETRDFIMHAVNRGLDSVAQFKPYELAFFDPEADVTCLAGRQSKHDDWRCIFCVPADKVLEVYGLISLGLAKGEAYSSGVKN